MSYLLQLTPSYYDTLIDWELLEAITQLVAEDEQHETYTIIIRILDHTVLETVLHHLSPSHHESFLELCYRQHHEPSLLSWLEDRHTGMSEILRTTIKTTKIQIKESILEQDLEQ